MTDGSRRLGLLPPFLAGAAAAVMRDVARAVAGRVSMQATTEAPTLSIT